LPGRGPPRRGDPRVDGASARIPAERRALCRCAAGGDRDAAIPGDAGDAGDSVAANHRRPGPGLEVFVRGHARRHVDERRRHDPRRDSRRVPGRRSARRRGHRLGRVRRLGRARGRRNATRLPRHEWEGARRRGRSCWRRRPRGAIVRPSPGRDGQAGRSRDDACQSRVLAVPTQGEGRSDPSGVTFKATRTTPTGQVECAGEPTTAVPVTRHLGMRNGSRPARLRGGGNGCR